MNFVEKSAKTIEEAVKLALAELNIDEFNASVDVLELPSKGFLGIGSKPARVRVSKLIDDENNFVEQKKVVKTESAPKVVQVKPAPIKPMVAKPAVESVKEKVNVEVKKQDVDEMVVKELAYNFMRDVLEAMSIKAEIKIKIEDHSMKVNLTGPKMGQIIGRRGQTLDALQYLLGLVVNKGVGKENYVRVTLDTEDYRAKREDTLEKLAKRMATQVVKTGKSVRLEPMNPYERRVIHATLQEYPGIVTFSEDEEPYRKVVIARK